MNEEAYFEQDYDEEGNPIDTCESEYAGYHGDGMDVDINCLEYLIAKNCHYCFGNPNVVDEWCSFVCPVRGPCHHMAKEWNDEE